MTLSEKRSLSRYQVWLLAARPRTLPAAAAPVIVGSALAYRDGFFQPWLALAALLTALLLQIGANLANDVFDYYRGMSRRRKSQTLVAATGRARQSVPQFARQRRHDLPTSLLCRHQ